MEICVNTITNSRSRPMWCPFCCVRVAPGDRQFQADGKIYHDRCYAKAKQLRKRLSGLE
jgi:hypothetical protein